MWPSRRRMPRFEIRAPLDVTVLRSGIPDTVPGRALNLSERGMAAMMAGELAAGETVGVELRLPMTTDPLRARALVKYQDKLRCGMEFVGFSEEQRAAVRDWAKAAKLESDKDGSAQREGKEADLQAVEAKMSKARAMEVRKPDTKGGEASSAEKPVPKAASEAVWKQGVREQGKRKWITGPWATVLVLVLIWAAIGLGIFWWRWNRSWAELESGLENQNAAAAEKPQAQVSAEVMQRLVTHRVEPVYPAEARQSNLQGIIALDIVVGRDGSVVSMRALNGPDVLARAAMDALRWWKFAPYRINGEPAVVETTVAVEFKR